MATYYKDPVAKRKYDSSRRALLRNRRMCIACNLAPIQRKRVRCENCISKETFSRKQRRQKGFCNSCSRQAIVGKSKCLVCWCSDRRRRFKLSKEETERMKHAHEIFDGACQCCGSKDPGGDGNWHTDHDHNRLIFRGILCSNCNSGLGLEKESVEILQKMISYLKKF